jgi:hypothetical protein
MHSHFYVGKTSYNDGHWHDYKGTTSSDPDIAGHVHYMSGSTSVDDGHSHGYRSATGPAIYLDGKHYHMYCGVTEIADQHTHTYNASTSIYHTDYYKKCSQKNPQKKG